MAEKKWISDELRMKILDAIIYACFGFILVWAILKAAGVFNTPIWLELAPIATGSMGAMFLVYRFGFAFGNLTGDVNHLKEDVKEIKHELKDFRKDYDYHIVKHHT